MTGEIIALFALSVLCDVAGQVAFKLGADRVPDPAIEGWRPFLAALVLTPWLLAGIAVYVVEFVVWIRILALVPLSIAFPLASLNILGIMVASRVFFNERLGRHQWAGVLLIMSGIILVAGSL